MPMLALDTAVVAAASMFRVSAHEAAPPTTSRTPRIRIWYTMRIRSIHSRRINTTANAAVTHCTMITRHGQPRGTGLLHGGGMKGVLFSSDQNPELEMSCLSWSLESLMPITRSHGTLRRARLVLCRTASCLSSICITGLQARSGFRDITQCRLLSPRLGQ